MDDCYRFNQPLPDAIANAPELYLGLELYYNGFNQLSSSRPQGFGVGAIPLSYILDYCQVYSIIGEDMDDFVWFITNIDRKFLDWWGKNNGKSR